jgi:hypothetical protein
MRSGSISEGRVMKSERAISMSNMASRTIDWRRALGVFLTAALVVPVMILSPNSRAQAEQIQRSADTY